MMEHCWDTDWFCWSSESEQCVSAKWRLTPLTCPLRAFADSLRSWVCVRRRTGWQKRVEECVMFCCERTDPHHYLTLGAAGFPIMGRKALSPFMLIFQQLFSQCLILVSRACLLVPSAVNSEAFTPFLCLRSKDDRICPPHTSARLHTF